MFQFHETTKMRVSPVSILEFVGRKAIEFEDINTDKPRIQLSCEHAHRECERMPERLVTGLEIDRCQHNWCAVEMAGQRAPRPLRRIALCPQPASGDSQRTVVSQAGGPLGEGYVIRMLQIEGKLCRRGVTRRRISLKTAQYDFLQPWRQSGCSL